ncbi:hypothetical protein AAU61_21655 [Desulfocarbo indianensis]|nr:hypothetical protein AAU61_21655 [Desulfocarbo indianensis]
MNRDLYFIKLMNQALTSLHPREAMRDAFNEIEKLGQQPGYEKGYRQFLEFMSLVDADEQAEQIDPEIWRRGIEEWLESTTQQATIPPMVLECDGEVLARLQVDEKRTAETVSGLTPGSYSLCLESGWVLWKGELSKADLIWRHAFPEEPLPLAAETEPASAKASREIGLLEGELVIKVTPGRSSGRMDIIYCG